MAEWLMVMAEGQNPLGSVLTPVIPLLGSTSTRMPDLHLQYCFNILPKSNISEWGAGLNAASELRQQRRIQRAVKQPTIGLAPLFARRRQTLVFNMGDQPVARLSSGVVAVRGPRIIAR